jgi:hypothetical protein
MRSASGIFAAVAAAALLFAGRPSPVSAAPQSACSLITLADARAIIGSPVVVFEPASSGPTVRGDTTISTCTYTVPNVRARAGTFSLIWAPPAKLSANYSQHQKLRGWQPRIKGNVLILASVTNGTTVDPAASTKLLDAVAKKVH